MKSGFAIATLAALGVAYWYLHGKTQAAAGIAPPAAAVSDPSGLYGNGVATPVPQPSQPTGFYGSGSEVPPPVRPQLIPGSVK